jgi:hypothetical protein
MTRIALLALVLATGCDDKKPEERKLPGAAAPTTGSPGTAGTSGTAGSAAPTPGSPGTGGTGGTGGTAGDGSSASGGPTPGSPGGSAAPAPKPTGFAPFDEALAGTRPWVAADDKAGVVELHAVDDLSGRTPGKFSVERRCGADAAKAVEAIGKQIPERLKTNHAQPTCTSEGAITRCVQAGLAEGDVVLEIEYAKTGDTSWRVNGVKTYGVGMIFQKETDRYTALLKEKCK